MVLLENQLGLKWRQLSQLGATQLLLLRKLTGNQENKLESPLQTLMEEVLRRGQLSQLMRLGES